MPRSALRRLIPLPLVLSGVCAVAGPALPASASNAAADGSGLDARTLWTAKIQPLFDIQCAKCHGPIEQKGGLEVDTPEAILKGGDEGPSVVPGKPEESRLYQYLAAEAETHMPPKKQLTDAERALIHEWITALGRTPPAAPGGTPAPAAPPRGFSSIEEAIGTLIAEGWQQRGITPAAPLEDTAWCRRIYLDLAGRIPTAAETADFLALPADTRRATLADKLLASPEYPVRMRELWDALLMGRGKRDNSEDRRRKNGWFDFLEHAFAANLPWDRTVRELLAARPAEDKPETRGASWFVFERRNEHQQIAEAVAPLIYGARIDCAQCHDHPLAREIKQSHYWGLVAAYNRSKNVDGTSGVGESAIGGFMNFTNLHKESQPAQVVLLTGKSIPETWPAGDQKEADSDDKYLDAKAKVRVPKFSRRAAFADAAVTDNPLLARAFVNRMWSAFLGRGLVHPADEMTARNVPSHPALLDWLANDFATHGYDVRRLLRGLVLSRPYALHAGSAGMPADSFAGALERPLSAEQAARSWRIAAGLPAAGDDTLRRAAIKAIPDVLPDNYNATFLQAQFLTSAPALAEVLQPRPGSTLEHLAALPDHAARVPAAFQAIYQRQPDPAEAAAALAFLDSRPPAEAAAALRDLLWALMTSAEFLTIPR